MATGERVLDLSGGAAAAAVASWPPAAVRALVHTSFVATRWLTSWRHVPADEVPEPLASFALSGKILLDELAITAAVLTTRVPSDDDRRRIGQEVAEARALWKERGWLDDPAAFHLDPPTLEAFELTRETSLGLEYRRLRWESEYEPHEGEPGRERWLGEAGNREAFAYVLEHAGPPRPWVVCIHAYQMGSPFGILGAFRANRLHHRLGLNVACPVLPLHGPRRSARKSGDGFLNGDYLNTVHGCSQSLWDVRRLLRWIRGRGAPAVAVQGLSLGGYLTALLASIEPELDCAILGVPATDFVRLARWHSSPLDLWMSEHYGPDWSDAEAATRVISPMALRPLLPRDRRFIFAGLADRLAPAVHVRDLWRHWERPRIAWYPGSHVTFRFEPEVTRLVDEALEVAGMIEPRRRIAANG